jgi:large subunit ribosomal protein L9
MEIILLEKVNHLGKLGDVVKVRGGYGRNYLIPKGIAVMATKANRERFEEKRAELERKSAEVMAAAQARADQIKGIGMVIITAHAGDEGRLFGSVGASDIVSALEAKGVSVERSEIKLPNGPLRTVGEVEIELQLHHDIFTTLTVSVIAG